MPPRGVGTTAEPSTTHQPGSLEPTRFVRAATTSIREAQTAMSSLLAGAGLAGARATEVGKRLGLDKTLAWKVSRFAEDDAMSATRHLPGPGGIEIVIKAAESSGVSRRRIDALRDADARLRAFMREHAGDRRTFEAMLAGGDRDERVEQEERRAYYKAGSAIWGVRARAQFLMLALRPSETDRGMLDVLQVGGLLDLERLRSDVPWIVRRLRATTDTGDRYFKVRREPVDPAGATAGGMPLLPEFCTQPLPEIRQNEASNGWIYDELAPGPVGRSGAVSIVTGEVYRSALPSVRSEENTHGRYVLTVRTPVEHAQVDILFHESLTHFGAPTASIVGLLEDRPRTGDSPPSHLAEPRPALDLGSPVAVRTHRLAGYEEMVLSSMERAGWGSLDDYRGGRVEADYPAPPCELCLSCPIGRSTS